MSKKHFIALAKALLDSAPATVGNGGQWEQWAQWARDVTAVAGVLGDSNPRFNRAKFLAACGMPKE